MSTQAGVETDAVASLPGIVAINVVESIEQPVAFPQTARTVTDAAVPFSLDGVGPEGSDVSFEITIGPAFGEVSALTGSSQDTITYTPDPAFTGVDQLSFTVSDGVSVSEPAILEIVVQALDAPVIIERSPVSGTVNGGQLVTIDGINFTDGDTEVRFGAAQATAVQVISPEMLTAITPAQAAGIVDVVVASPAGESVFRSGYSFEAAISQLVAAVLPTSRSVQVGMDATALASIVNSGNETLEDCRIELASSVDAAFSFQTTDPENNALIGTPGVGVDVLPGSAQSFVFRLTLDAPIAPTNVELNFICDGGVTAPVVQGLNTLQLSASNTPIPDVIALNAVNAFLPLPAGTVGVGVGSSVFYAVAAANVGAGDTVEVEVSATDPALPVSLSICRDILECVPGGSSTLSTDLAANQTDSFFILVEAAGDIPFEPATSRLLVEFRDSTGVVRGSTSVAVAIQ